MIITFAMIGGTNAKGTVEHGLSLHCLWKGKRVIKSKVRINAMKDPALVRNRRGGSGGLRTRQGQEAGEELQQTVRWKGLLSAPISPSAVPRGDVTLKLSQASVPCSDRGPCSFGTVSGSGLHVGRHLFLDQCELLGESGSWTEAKH